VKPTPEADPVQYQLLCFAGAAVTSQIAFSSGLKCMELILMRFTPLNDGKIEVKSSV
jgi:hypothetical protein